MAKADGVSVVEQHIEKLVLVVCLALLGWAAARWVASSPASLAVIAGDRSRVKKTVPPEEVDQTLRRSSQRIWDEYERAQVPVEPVAKWYDNVLDLRNIAEARRELVDTAPPGQPLKVEIRGRGKPVRLAELEKPLVAPSTPLVEGFVELPKKPVLADVIVARGSVLYPLGQLREAWETVLKERPVLVSMVATKVVVEVQQALPDGQWGPEREVETTVVTDGENKTPLPEPIPAYTGQNVEEVRKARAKWAEAGVQEQVLRPTYWPIWLGGGWAPWNQHLPKLGQPKTGEMAVWFHDDRTMKYGETYRYRLRIVFVNPILTYDEQVANDSPQDARTQTVATAFSEWSDPVRVDRQVHFFLTGASEAMRLMQVTVYAQVWGQWVSRTFRLQPGEMIGSKVSVKLGARGEKGEARTVDVDFSTGAVSLRFDYRKTLLRDRIKLRTAELLYLDADGKLKSRIQALDDRSELHERLQREVKQAGQAE